MVSQRERSRPTRRRIAGERSRLPGGLSGTEAPASPEAPQEPEGRDGFFRDAAAEEAAAAPPREAVTPPGTADEKAAPAEDEKAAPAEDEKAGPTRSGRQPEAPQTGRAGGTPPNWALAVLAGLLVAALALDGFVVWREVSRRNAEEASARALHSALVQAPSVAEQAAGPLLSYRHDTIDRDLAEAQRYLTDGFRPGYTASVEQLVRREAKRAQATVEAEVLSSGVVEAGGQRADVLLFVDQTTTMPTRSEPTTALNRVVFSMVRRDGTWKVADIRAF